MSSPSTLRERLRAATRAGHAALDSHPMLAPLGRDDLDAPRYADALLGLHSLFAPLERRLVEAPPALGGFEAARRVPHLEADLAELGRGPRVSSLALDVGSSVPASVGVAYVVLGSALGGQAIAARLAKRPGAPLPTRFFASAIGAAARFRELMADAERLCPPGAHDDAARAAAAVFDAMVRELDRLAAAPG